MDAYFAVGIPELIQDTDFMTKITDQNDFVAVLTGQLVAGGTMKDAVETGVLAGSAYLDTSNDAEVVSSSDNTTDVAST